MPVRLSDASQEDLSQPTRLNTVRLGSLYNPTNLEFATINNPESIDVQKQRGLFDSTKTFLTETGKAIPRGIMKIPSSLEAGWQGVIDNLRNNAKKKAADAGAVFGISEEKFKSRTPEQQKIIDNANKEILSLNRAEDISKNLRQSWIDNAEKTFPRDKDIFSGEFTQNPSWTRAVALGMESAPLLGVAAAITVATKNPLIGASAIGTIQGVEERAAAKEAGASTETANNVFLANAIVGSALENIPLTKFLKGGSIPLKAFEKGFGKKVGTALEVGATEATEEALQQVWTNSVAQIGYDKTRNLTEGLVESIVAGSVSGGLIGSFSPARTKELNDLITEARNSNIDVDKMIDVVSKQVVDNGDAISGAILDKANEIPMKQGSKEALSNVVVNNKENIVSNEPIVNNQEQISTNIGVENAQGTGEQIAPTSQKEGVVQEAPTSIRVRNNEQVEQVGQEKVVKQEVVKVPARQIPVGEGNKISGIAKSIETKALEDGLISKGIDKLAGYDSSTIKEQARIFKDTLDANGVEHIREIIRGDKPLPEGAKSFPFIVNIELYLKSNPNQELIYELGNSPLVSSASEAASNLSLGQNRTKDSYTSKVNEIKKAKIERFGGDEKYIKAKKKAVKELKEATERINLTDEELGTLDSFFKEIGC